MSTPRIILGLTLLQLLAIPVHFSHGQISVLSSGNVNLQWRSTQLKLLEDQLADETIKGALRLELESQQTWLSQWKAGTLTDQAWLTQSSHDSSQTEPLLDPDNRAAKLRQMLLGKNARPTARETQQLQKALESYPKDLGLRQLYLHWIDQKQYRNTYAPNVVESASTLVSMLDQTQDLKKDDPIPLLKAYCFYRAARALIHMESEEYQAKQPIEDQQQHEAQLLGFYTQLRELVDTRRPEFLLVELRMLCRDHWYGQALMLLEANAKSLDAPWYLAQRHKLLTDLGWQQPANESAAIVIK